MGTDGEGLFTVTITLKVRGQAAAVEILADILRQIKSGAVKTEGWGMDCYGEMEVQGNLAHWSAPLPVVAQ